MVRIQQVETIDKPELEPYLTLKRTVAHRRQGIFVAEGEKVVRRFLQSPLKVVSLLLTPDWLDTFHPLLERRPEGVIDVFVVEREKIEHWTGFRFYQGVLAVGKIPSSRSLADVLANRRRPSLFVAIDSVLNSQNLGLLVRNSAAFGVDALLVGETSSSPFLRRAVRNSMGAVFQLPSVELDDLRGTLKELRRQRIRVIAAHPHTKAGTIAGADLREDVCFVFGSEGYGLSEEVLAECDEAVAIPMAGGVDSLNVGNASAVFLYETSRQRGGM